MQKKINWQINVQVDGGPKLVVPGITEIEAYDMIEAVVPKKGVNPGKAEIGIQPGVLSSLRMVFVGVADPKHYKSEVSYSVGADEADPDKRVKLDAAQFLVGAGAVGLLGKAPDKFFVYNNLNEDVTVQVLVGRKATV